MFSNDDGTDDFIVTSKKRLRALPERQAAEAGQSYALGAVASGEMRLFASDEHLELMPNSESQAGVTLAPM